MEMVNSDDIPARKVLEKHEVLVIMEVDHFLQTTF
jgi:hypothetical protein